VIGLTVLTYLDLAEDLMSGKLTPRHPEWTLSVRSVRRSSWSRAPRKGRRDACGRRGGRARRHLLARWWPAGKAAGVDPMTILRTE